MKLKCISQDNLGGGGGDKKGVVYLANKGGGNSKRLIHVLKLYSILYKGVKSKYYLLYFYLHNIFTKIVFIFGINKILILIK